MGKKKNKLEQAISVFKKSGGILSMSEALRKGIHRYYLYLLRNQGILEVLGRGLYRLKTVELPSSDFITVAKKISQGVICLTSALAFHGITTQIPHIIYVAIPSRAHKPSMDYPPIKCFWYSDKSLRTGVVKRKINGYPIKIFDMEKTLIDCLKFRNKIGMDIILEALKMYWQRKGASLNKLFEYAEMFRMEKILRPIMETITSR